MRPLGRFAAAAVVLMGGGALDELSQSQLAALSVLSPLAQEQLDRKNGQALAECMVLAGDAEGGSRLAAGCGMAPSQGSNHRAQDSTQRPGGRS